MDLRMDSARVVLKADGTAVLMAVLTDCDLGVLMAASTVASSVYSMASWKVAATAVKLVACWDNARAELSVLVTAAPTGKQQANPMVVMMDI
jgi:hypothetical protein